MKVPAIGSANETSQAIASSPTQTRVEQISDMFLMMMGLSIYRENRTICNEASSNKASACYVRIGTGNLICVSNKISILTVSTLFSNEPTNYALLHDNQLMAHFNYSNQQSMPEAALIPIGVFDHQSQQLLLLSNRIEGKLHYHL